MVAAKILLLSAVMKCFLCKQAETIHQIERSIIVEVLENVEMKAFYKNIDVTNIPTNVSWKKGSRSLTIGGRFQLSYNNTVLTIKEVELKDKGIYKSVLTAVDTPVYVTEFTIIVRKGPIPKWAVALIVAGLVLLLIGTIVFFKCRQEISEVVVNNIQRRKRTYTTETSFHE